VVRCVLMSSVVCHVTQCPHYGKATCNPGVNCAPSYWSNKTDGVWAKSEKECKCK
jgi:hypothetical protein